MYITPRAKIYAYILYSNIDFTVLVYGNHVMFSGDAGRVTTEARVNFHLSS